MQTGEELLRVQVERHKVTLIMVNYQWVWCPILFAQHAHANTLYPLPPSLPLSPSLSSYLFLFRALHKGLYELLRSNVVQPLQLYVCKLLSHHYRVFAHTQNIDLGKKALNFAHLKTLSHLSLGVNQPLHGDNIQLGQYAFIFSQST